MKIKDSLIAFAVFIAAVVGVMFVYRGSTVNASLETNGKTRYSEYLTISPNDYFCKPKYNIGDLIVMIQEGRTGQIVDYKTRVARNGACIINVDHLVGELHHTQIEYYEFEVEKK